MITKYLLPNIFLLLLTTSTAWANSPDDLNRSSQLLKQTEDTQNISIDNVSNLSEVQVNSDDIAQVTSVSQLSDVKPTDWAFQAIQSLVERYSCITGYPGQIYRGNRALTRYEFAAGLNKCLSQIDDLIHSGSSELVRKEDLVVIKNLQDQFATELATLKGRIDNIGTREEILETHQFSTTTKFGGEVVFSLATAFGGNPPGGLCSYDSSNVIGNVIRNFSPCNPRQKPSTNTVFSDLVRFGLETSFTGNDILRTYITTGNSNPGGFANPSSLDTNMARLSDQASLNNQFRLDLMEYRLPVLHNNAEIIIIPTGFALSSILAPNSAYFDIGRGAISDFGQVNPIFKIGGGSAYSAAGVGFDLKLNNKARLQIAYGAGDNNDPTEGVTQSNRSVLGVNLLANLSKHLITGLTYVNAYSSDGSLGTFTGSVNADTSGHFSGGGVPNPNGSGPLIPIGNLPAQTHAVGATLQWRIAPKLTFGAWGGLTFTNYLKALPNYLLADGITVASGVKPFANTATYLFSLGFSDPFNREGDLFAILIGMPPKLTNSGPVVRGESVPFSEISLPGESAVLVSDGVGNIQNETVFGNPDKATSMHYEVFYRYKVNDHLWITPGFFMVTNPGDISSNNTIYVGAIRTTFRF